MAASIQTAKILLEEALAIRESSVETAKKLLEGTSKIREEFENKYEYTGAAYNIFKVAKIYKDERKMCRVLADLLNPKGIHYRKDLYLKLFIKMVEKKGIEIDVALDLSKAEVIREYPTNKGKRIDIVIKIGKVFIPIEAKINAKDSERQLADYAAFSREKNPDDHFIPVLFLTHDGHPPLKKVELNEYICISFKNDILSWLEKCLLEESDERAPVKEMLKQYIKAIKSFCGIMEDEEMAKDILEKLVLKSWVNYAAAREIYKLLDCDCLNGELMKFFEEKICNLIDNAKCIHGTVKEEWPLYLEIDLGNGYKFYVNHDMKIFQVMSHKVKKPITTTKDNEAEEIGRIMSNATGECNIKGEKGSIWLSDGVKYRDFKDIDDDEMYKYKLYWKYKEKPEEVAKWIVDIAEALKKVKTA